MFLFTVVSIQIASQGGFAQTKSARGSASRLVLFGSGGMRQDLLMKFVQEGSISSLSLDSLSYASGNGMLTEAPADSGAGWFSLATGAWGGVHGSVSDIFHINGQPIANRVSSFSAGTIQAETLAQAAERGGHKVAQIEWSGGRAGNINGPTVDSREFFSGRGVATNYVSASDNAGSVAQSGLQFDHPAGFAGQPPFPGTAPSPAAGWVNVPASYSPAMEMRMRVIDFGVDKYGQNAYIFDSTNDGLVNYDRVLFAPAKDGARSTGTAFEGGWVDVKVSIAGGPSAGLTAGFLIKIEKLYPDLSHVRLFHTSVARAVASWPGWPGEPGFSGDFAEYVAQRFPSSTNADSALLSSGIVSEDTYVEQGLYWETCYQPLARYLISKYRPDLLMQGYPVTGDFQQAFLGLITPVLPQGAPNPVYEPGDRLAAREAYLRRAYQGAAETLRLSRSLTGADPATFLVSDHGAAPQFLAIDASRILVDLGLLSRPQTSNCRPATGETIGKAKACWSGGSVQIYLNVAGRDPVVVGLQQVAAVDVASTVESIKTAFLNLSDPFDWTGDGNPEGWKMIDRAFTRPESRYVPNGPGSTADMAHPTRTGDVVVFAFPPYQFEGSTPGTLVARSALYGQHGYSPDLLEIAAGINMRGALVAFGQGIKEGVAAAARTIDIAPTAAFLLKIPQPQYSQGRPLFEMLNGGSQFKPISILGFADYHGQLDPKTLLVDRLNVPFGGAAYLASLFDEETAGLSGPVLLLSSGDNIGATPPNSSLIEDRPAIAVENAWGVDATTFGTHEFDRGIQRLRDRQTQANFPFLAVNIVEAATGLAPPWIQPSVVYQVNGTQIGVIGAAMENTPAFVPPAMIAGLKFLPAAERIRAESERLRSKGVKVQIVMLHEGTGFGGNSVDGAPLSPWTGPAIDIAQSLQDTTVDVILAGHTHRVSNTMLGRILVAQGLNAGTSYSVVQLATTGGDVSWAGAATRLAKNLGISPRADVETIVNNANAATAVLINQVIGTQAYDIKRDPARLSESAMGNLVADAMRARYPGIEAAFTHSGELRADLLCAPPTAGEGNCEITWSEMFSVLPFGDRTVIETVSYEQLTEAFINGLWPACDASISTARFPQISGMQVSYSCAGTVPVINSIHKGGIALNPGDRIRLVIDDHLFGGEEGYTAFEGGGDVLNTDDSVLDITIDYVGQNSPVSPVVDSRIVPVH